MRVEPSKSAWRPGVTPTTDALAWVAALGAVALWTAVLVRMQVDHGAFQFGHTTKFVVVYGPPLVLIGLLTFDERLARLQPLRVATLLAAIVLVAHLLADRLTAGDSALLALPALVVTAAILRRRPLIAVVVLIVISGAYGDLIAYWAFPYQKTAQLILGGALLALAWQAFIAGRDYSVRLSASLLLITVYVYWTFGQTVLDHSNGAAWKGFFSSGWYMVAALVIAVAGWRREQHDRAAKILLVVIVAVGGYAVYRWIVGVSVTEFSFYGSQPFNYVGTKLKLLGSFPGGQDLGGWTAIVIPFCLAAALAFRDRWRVIALLGAGLCAIALVGSQTRVAVPAVAFGSLCVLLLYQRSHAFRGVRIGTTVTALALMLALGAVAYGVTGGSQDTSSHGYATLLHPTDRRDQSVSQRFYKWQTAVRDLRDHPFGYGIGTANANSFGLVPHVLSIGAYNVDNGYLRVALEQGFVVMILYAALLLFLVLDLARAGIRATSPVSAGIAIGAAGAAVSFAILLIAGAFQDGPRALPLWILAGLGLAQYTTRRSARS
jgi:O-Antigen ligase